MVSLMASDVRANAEALGAHLARLESLEADRQRFELEGRRDLVLAVNYELSSEAARALLVLRKLEELGAAGPAQDLAMIRSPLHQLASIPGIPRRDLGPKAPFEINTLHFQYQAMTAAWHGHHSDQFEQSEDTPDIWTVAMIKEHFGISDEEFQVKYQSYALTLSMTRAESNWNP